MSSLGSSVINNNHPIHQLSPARLTALQSYLRPGGASEVGFLAATDSLVTVCDEDHALLQKIEITYQQIADQLRAIIAKADVIWQNPREKQNPLIGGKFEVTCLGSGGWQTCPFDENDDDFQSCGKGSRNYTVTNISTRESVNFPELGPHLIEAHQFFEGHTEYRMDPTMLCRVLELKPNVSYKHSTVSRQTWSSPDYNFGTQFEEAEAAAKTNAKEFQKINDVATAYLLPYHSYDDYKYRDLTQKERDVQKRLGKNHTEEQFAQALKRQAELDAFSNDLWARFGKQAANDRDKKCWEERPGQDYCHLFVSETFDIADLPFMVFNRKVDNPVRATFTDCPQLVPGLDQGMHIYELETHVEAVLDAKDLQPSITSTRTSSALDVERTAAP